MTDSGEQFDAAIIGGGVIGCSIAWRLAQSGLRVALVERGDPGCESSRAAGGMLAPLVEADRMDDFYQLAVASRASYPHFAAELREASGIDVEYRAEGTLYLALTEEDEEELERRWMWQHSAGLNVKRLNAESTLRIEPLISEKLRWALMFPDDHQVNNRQLMIALTHAARKAGARILTHTETLQLNIDSKAGQKQIRGIRTTRGQIKSDCVIVAAGSWSTLLTFETGHSPGRFQVDPVRGQMVGLEMPIPPIRHVLYSRHAYLIPRLNGSLIAGSTTEHTGYDRRVTAGGIASIIERAVRMLPCISGLAITETWAGLRPRSSDELPIIGQDPSVSGLIYATGHYRNGILLAPITAKIISELMIKGESSINLAPFSVARFKTRRTSAG
ncbi:MAG: glycine oxidase ThiO [Acidobacteria bacterium]|nr:glycine oxidase ThiO [Acidobacteriota bacterium]